ncbi:MAG: cyclic nucleotide-binding domain-containing protein [Planctomycetota bacterium]
MTDSDRAAPFRHQTDIESLAPGQFLFRQGELGDRMFVVQRGWLSVLRDGRMVARVGPGSLLGEMAMLDGGERVAGVLAETPTRVVPIDRQQFRYLLQQRPYFADTVIATLVDRLRALLDRGFGARP